MNACVGPASNVEHIMTEETEVYGGELTVTKTQLKKLQISIAPKTVSPVTNFHFEFKGTGSEVWALFRCGLVKCCYGCGNNFCFMGRTLYPNQIRKGLKGIPYSMERPCVIGLTIRKGEQKTLYKTIIKQKLIFGPAQHCEIKTPEIAIHCVVPFGPEVPMEEIQIQIILAILPVGEPVYDIPQVPFCGPSPICRPVSTLQNAWYDREETGDLTIRIVNDDQMTIYETKAHKFVIMAASGILKKMFTSGCKETTNSELVLTVNSETCKMFLHFCYFGTFSRPFLDSLTNEIFVIAMELGFLAHSYQMYDLLKCSQHLCTYQLSCDQSGNDGDEFVNALNTILRGNIPFESSFLISMAVYAKLRYGDVAGKMEVNMFGKMSQMCNKSCRHCQTCMEVEHQLQLNLFNDLLL